LAYIGLKPKSSHTTKYSQPFELVLFHVITVYINCHKGSYHPHLLNNYLFNYLIFSGLTPCTCGRNHYYEQLNSSLLGLNVTSLTLCTVFNSIYVMFLLCILVIWFAFIDLMTWWIILLHNLKLSGNLFKFRSIRIS